MQPNSMHLYLIVKLTDLHKTGTHTQKIWQEGLAVYKSTLPHIYYVSEETEGHFIVTAER